jgi:hypothetical protein
MTESNHKFSFVGPTLDNYGEKVLFCACVCGWHCQVRLHGEPIEAYAYAMTRMVNEHVSDLPILPPPETYWNGLEYGAC